MREGNVTVPMKVMEGLEAVRVSGKTNMLDAPMVAYLALEMGFPDAAIWVTENRNLYARGIFQGFSLVDSSKDKYYEKTDCVADSEGCDA